jgi:hypothetical protein
VRAAASSASSTFAMERDNQQHDGEIVELHSPDNGRPCNLHDYCDYCGRQVVPGHVVRFKREVQEDMYRTPGNPDPDVRIETFIKSVCIVPLNFFQSTWLQDCKSVLVCITCLLR